jgi:DNA invertase Pin-like site-specific DNA recombinase
MFSDNRGSPKGIHVMNGKFIAYFRVSTDRQGKSGLGLEAQRTAVANYLNGGSWTVSAEYTEVESGRKATRPQLARALAECRLTGATLVVAKLDRLARNVRFLMDVVDGSGAGGVVFCDLPDIPPGPTGRFILQQMAAVAELEAGLISARTKAALAASKKKLGGWRGGPKPDSAVGRAANAAKAAEYARNVSPIVTELRNRGLSLRQIAGEMTTRGIMTPRRGVWTAAAVSKLLP